MADDGSGFWGDIGTGAQNFFGGINSAFSGSNPGMMPMLGLIQGAGAASTPSRMPVTKGMVFGDLAGGWAGGMQAGQQAQMAQSELQQRQLSNAMAIAQLRAQSNYNPDLIPPSFVDQLSRQMGVPMGVPQSQPSGQPGARQSAPGQQGAAAGGTQVAQASQAVPGGIATDAGGSPAAPPAQSPYGSLFSPAETQEIMRAQLLHMPDAAIAARLAPTNYQKAVQFANSLPEGPEKQQASLAAAKAAGIDVSPNFRPGSMGAIWDPASQTYKVSLKNPQLPTGMDYEPPQNGQPGFAYQVPGAFQGIAEQAGIHAGAELGMHQALAHFTTGLTKAEWEEKDPASGDIVKKQGTGLDYLAAVNGNRVPGAVPQQGATGAAPASGAAPPTAGVPTPQPKPPVPQPAASATPSRGISIPVGAAARQEEVAKAGGEQAAKSAQMQATTEGLNAAIDRALAINDKVPYGSYGTADARVGLSNLPGVGSYLGGDNAKYAALYHQEIGSNILSGLQQLKGLGRLDIPEVNQVINTYGIGMENNPAARRAALLNLRQIINNNAAMAKNSTANLNQPGTASSTERGPVTNTPVTGERPDWAGKPDPAAIPGAIPRLKANANDPAEIQMFERTFGKGRAAAILGQPQQ